MKKKKEVSLKECIEKITTPIFNKVLSENSNNPMRGGRVQKAKEIKWLWQPHNHRLYFNFNKKNYKPVTTLPIYKYPSFKFKSLNYDSEHHYINFNNCRIIIRKNSVEVINKSYERQWVLCTAYSNTQIKEIIDKRVNRLNQEGINALKGLIRLCGGISDCKILKVRGEHGIHGIEYLDKIPDDMIIHDTIFKKVYKRKVEFYDPANIKNTVSNFALKEFAPEISNSINGLSSKFDKFIDEFLPIQKEFAVNIKTHTKVLKGIDKSFKKFNNLLSQKNLLKWL